MRVEPRAGPCLRGGAGGRGGRRHDQRTRLGRLAQTAEQLRGAFPAVTIDAAAGDITTTEGREALLGACPQPDILVNNNAGPTPSPFLETTEEAWTEALEANMLAALMLIRAVLPGMIERRFGRIVNITSAMVTTPRGHLGVSAGPRAGLTAVCKGIARDVAQHNVTVNNLLPERFDTDRQRYMAERDMQRHGISMEEARGGSRRPSPPGAWAGPRSSGPRARSCAPRTPGT